MHGEIYPLTMPNASERPVCLHAINREASKIGWHSSHAIRGDIKGRRDPALEELSLPPAANMEIASGTRHLCQGDRAPPSCLLLSVFTEECN